MTTEEIREEGKKATANECYALLCDALDEVNKWEKECVKQWQAGYVEGYDDGCKETKEE